MWTPLSSARATSPTSLLLFPPRPRTSRSPRPLVTRRLHRHSNPGSKYPWAAPGNRCSSWTAADRQLHCNHDKLRWHRIRRPAGHLVANRASDINPADIESVEISRERPPARSRCAGRPRRHPDHYQARSPRCHDLLTDIFPFAERRQSLPCPSNHLWPRRCRQSRRIPTPDPCVPAERSIARDQETAGVRPWHPEPRPLIMRGRCSRPVS